MLYKSTRNKNLKLDFSSVIVKGISEEGGLFVPDKFLPVSREDLVILTKMDYVQRAVFILKKFLTDFTDAELFDCVKKAYSPEKFSSGDIARLKSLSDSVFVLELWHGPTCAFKDMALQLLAHLLKKSLEKQGIEKNVAVLVATSGDTGKAALEGFRDVEGTGVLVFYPENGVSKIQKLQMATQLGKNVDVCAIAGNFDDAQSGVKKIFNSAKCVCALKKSGYLLSSANSINWGRLVPQIVYYFSAYCDMLKNCHIHLGEPVNIAVPTGNFGNLLAAYYAKKMGLPVKNFICASNKNNILTDFIHTGIYNANRKFYSTTSPSMDILISSNLERLLFDLYDEDDLKINELYHKLSTDGVFEISQEVKIKLKNEFYGGFCDDDQTKKSIKNVLEKYEYLCDPHTAVAFNVYNEYFEKTNDKTKTIIVSTASPYKFSKTVLEAVDKNMDEDKNIFNTIEKLSEVTKTKIPSPILQLKNLKIRFDKTISKSDMFEYILKKFD